VHIELLHIIIIIVVSTLISRGLCMVGPEGLKTNYRLDYMRQQQQPICDTDY